MFAHFGRLARNPNGAQITRQSAPSNGKLTDKTVAARPVRPRLGTVPGAAAALTRRGVRRWRHSRDRPWAGLTAADTRTANLKVFPFHRRAATATTASAAETIINYERIVQRPDRPSPLPSNRQKLYEGVEAPVLSLEFPEIAEPLLKACAFLPRHPYYNSVSPVEVHNDGRLFLG